MCTLLRSVVLRIYYLYTCNVGVLHNIILKQASLMPKHMLIQKRSLKHCSLPTYVTVFVRTRIIRLVHYASVITQKENIEYSSKKVQQCVEYCRLMQYTDLIWKTAVYRMQQYIEYCSILV